MKKKGDELGGKTDCEEPAKLGTIRQSTDSEFFDINS